MQKCYLSHPRCRFSLRILASPQGSAKGRSEDVVYAPSKTVQEAVQKAVGKDVAAACEWIDTSSAAYAELLAEDADEEGDEDPIVIEAFLPKPSADPAIISKKPQCTYFIFVDSRSVSCARGTLKQIHTLYKSYLKSALSVPGLSDPFVYLNIRCPPGSYDPNIEPAKDDVMFHDTAAVVESVERMLRRFYGELKQEDKGVKAKEVVVKNGFELLLARKPKAPAPAPVLVPVPGPANRGQPLPLVRPLEIMDYDVDEDEEELAAREMDVALHLEREAGEFMTINSPVKKNPPSALVDKDQPIESARDDLDAPSDSEDLEEIAGPSTAPGAGTGSTTTLATPRRKSTAWGFNMFGGAEDDYNDDGDDDEPMEQHDSGTSLSSSLYNSLTVPDNEEAARRDITLSNPWTAAKLNAPLILSPPASGSSPLAPTPRRASQPIRKPFKPPSVVRPPGSQQAALPTPSPSSPPTSSMFRDYRGSGVRRVRPAAGGSPEIMDSWIRGTNVDSNEDSPPAARRGFVSAATVHQDLIEDPDEDEPQRPTKRTTKGATNPKRRRLSEGGFTPINAVPGRSRSSPHKNRFLAATAALNPPRTVSPPPLPSVGRTSSKRHRTKTLLPLDIVPEVSLQTHSLRRTVDLTGRLRGLFQSLRESDAYVGGAAATTEEEEGEGLFFSECSAWDEVAVLGAIVKGWLLEVAERAGGVEEVAGVEWEWSGEGDERVLWAVGVEEEEEVPRGSIEL